MMINKEHNSRDEEHAWETWHKRAELFSKSLKKRGPLGHLGAK